MTGSGKTHTMLGDIYKTSTGEPGICTLAISSLFSEIRGNQEKIFHVRMSYLEIYNEHTRDLLNGNNEDTTYADLLIVEDPKKGITVQELTEYEINSPEELLELMLKGNQCRTMAPTRVNQFSSRSHAMINIVLESQSKIRGVTEEVSFAKFSIVDLAGCERAAASDNKGIRMLEGGKINRSLLALGNCINRLSDKNRTSASYVPYRDSKLTRLLKDSLGGNTKTVMIACVSPGDNFYDETLNTLKYAERASSIKKTVTRNIREVGVHISQYKEIIDSLRHEITTLKNQLETQQKEGIKILKSNLSVSKEVEMIEEEIKKAKDSKDIIASANPNILTDKPLELSVEQDELKKSLEVIQEVISHDKILLNNMEQRLTSQKVNNEIEDILQLQNDIALMKKTIEGSEQVKKAIEHALQQRKFFETDSNGISTKDPGVDEEEKIVKDLRLEKIDLVIQNLEMKKKLKCMENENEEKNQLFIVMRKEIDNLKDQLKDKELEIISMKFSCQNSPPPRAASKKSVVSSKKKHSSSKNPFNRFSTSRETQNNSSSGMTINLMNVKAMQNKIIKKKSGRSSSRHNSKHRDEVCYKKTFSIQTKDKFNTSLSSLYPFYNENKKKTKTIQTAYATHRKQRNFNMIEEADMSQERRKSLIINTDKDKDKDKIIEREINNKIPRDAIVIKAVLNTGNQKKRCKDKEIPLKSTYQDEHRTQIKSVYIDLKKHKVNQALRINLGSSIPIKEEKELRCPPRQFDSLPEEKDKQPIRSRSLNPVISELRNRRKRGKNARLEFSLVPMKDLLEELGSSRKDYSMKHIMEESKNEKTICLTPQAKKKQATFTDEVLHISRHEDDNFLIKESTRNEERAKALNTFESIDHRKGSLKAGFDLDPM